MTHFAATADADDKAEVYEILRPTEQSLPLVLASPHSGTRYPPDFLRASRLDDRSLRKSEDTYVDEIFAQAPALGAPLLRARFPRAFLDANREAYELDPAMFADRLPPWVNTRSARVAAGLGTIPRIVASGEEIYRAKLDLAEAFARIDRFYHPYHAALSALVEETRSRFGFHVLLDCHSMPSSSGPLETGGRLQADFVLGDRHGSACSPRLMNVADDYLRSLGYRVNRNTPYAGGFTTRHYGRPKTGRHALQIEINRALYMEEATYERKPHLEMLARQMSDLVARLGAVAPA